MQPVIPGLYSPFDPRINPHVDTCAVSTANWVTKFQLHIGEAYSDYLNQRLTCMTARFYPTADKDRLITSDAFNTLLFAMDDAMDHNVQPDDIIRSREKFLLFIEKCISILQGKGKISDRTGLLAALADVWEQVHAISTEAWRATFIGNIQKMFDAALWGYDNLLAGKLPGIREFYQIRPFLGAAHISTDLIEITEKIYLPPHILHHPFIEEMTRLAQISICVANDLFSYKKETDHGDDNNIVSIIAHERCMSIQEATEQAADLHNRDVQQFVDLWQKCPDFGIHGTEVHRYLTILSAMMRGNIDWSRQESNRYRFNYKEDITAEKINRLNDALLIQWH